MDSKKGFQNLARYWVGSIFILLMCGCTIGRVYVGSELQFNPSEKIVSGQTNKSQVLDIFGAPDLIQRQHDGDVFVYAYLRRNYSKLSIQEPVVTRIQIFSYSNIQEKKDNLVILFDREGTVKNFGFQRRTGELTPY
jgi:outer membrane protein assembly factor BamE (lipoprotein component of BamABCDE complex)